MEKYFTGKTMEKSLLAISKVTRLYPEDGWYISLANGGTKFDLAVWYILHQGRAYEQSVIWFLYIKMDHILGKLKTALPDLILVSAIF